jgi:hypothetical protein
LKKLARVRGPAVAEREERQVVRFLPGGEFLGVEGRLARLEAVVPRDWEIRLALLKRQLQRAPTK